MQNGPDLTLVAGLILWAATGARAVETDASGARRLSPLSAPGVRPRVLVAAELFDIKSRHYQP